MSPSLGRSRATDDVTRTRIPTAVVVYVIGLVVGALVLIAVLAATGQSWPGPGLLLLLAIPLALCVNRYLFFANQVGVTADVAVLFAAMVAFRHDSPWLGPLLLAVLVAPLDVRHCTARSFTQMAFNSGSTAWVAVAGLAVFVPLSEHLGASWEATVGAAVIAAFACVAVESILGVLLFALLGEPALYAARHQVPLNTIAVPLAVIGALAGLAALGAGWWLMIAILWPVQVVPELVFVALPRRWAPTALLAAAGVALLATTLVLPGELLPGVSGVCALALLAVAECRPSDTTGSSSLLWAPLCVAACLLVWPATGSPTLTLVGGAVAGAAVVLLLVEWRCALWTLPVVALVATVGLGWAMAGQWGAVGGCAVLVTVLRAAERWGPLPWSSMLLARGVGDARLTLVAIVAAGVASSALLTVVASGDVALWAARVTSIALAATAVLLAVAARLWRFAARARRRDVLFLVATGVVALGGPGLAARRPAAALLLVTASATSAVVELVAITRRVTRSEDLDIAHGQ